MTGPPGTAALTSGPVGRTIWHMTLGMFVGQLAMTVFNLTDTWFVSRLGTGPLAAMGFTFPVIMITNGVMFGLGVGCSAVVSRAIGQGDSAQVRRLTTHALWLATIVALVIAALGLVFYRRIFAAMGAEGKTLDLTCRYMQIWYFGFPLGGIPMVLNNAIRATGDAKTPGVIMASVAIANMIMDPILIFGLGPVPALGLAGAALATVIGRTVSTIWAISVLQNRMHMFEWKRPRPAVLWNSWRRFLTVGAPATMTMIVMPLSAALLTRILSGFGDPAVAAWGAGGRVDMVAFMLLMAMGSVLLPFVGQNEGAGLHDRSSRGVHWAVRFGVIYTIGAGAVIALSAVPVSRLFSDDPAVLEVLVTYLRLMPLCYAAVSVAVMCYNALMGLDRPHVAMWLTLIRNLCVYVPLAWLGSRIYGVPGLIVGVLVGAYLSAVVAWWLYRHFQRIAGAVTR